ncbi:hypothetical protein J6590_099492, partial [Homalodisca vitripennis]
FGCIQSWPAASALEGWTRKQRDIVQGTDNLILMAANVVQRPQAGPASDSAAFRRHSRQGGSTRSVFVRPRPRYHLKNKPDQFKSAART